ncbi:aldose 1-epimerase family protein [Arachidicoccus sp.]|jgi:galactose mutarotase-like enzyme|uniref:aldose 1-epimerase family protein n=1 Tax=Arachidicoccus sp. TaxID=1872624 RepID=UPI003D1D44FC
MYKLENEILSISIATKGAEIQSIYNKNTHLDYLWDGNPSFWSKRSPILFPIVGGLKNNEYSFNHHTYQLSRHGFARDKEFTVIRQSADSISFSLQNDEETLLKYPFHFELVITYTLQESKIDIAYSVTNNGSNKMWFSIGAHPAFKVPLVEGTRFENYFLSFNRFENTARYPLNKEGLLKEDPEIFLQNTNELPLEKSLFYDDALVFKTLESTSISIESEKTPHGVTIEFKGFPFMGIWSAKDADFVCVEPWHGIADSENTSGKLERKEGILSLDAHKTFNANWSISLF